MHRNAYRFIVLLVVLLAACAPAAMPSSNAPATKAAATATAAAQATQEMLLYPLAAPGPYAVGWRTYAFNDASRNNRRVGITVWYPALPAANAENASPLEDAEPDASGAPYPLIVSSTKMAKAFAPYLVSRGFTWASVNLIDTYAKMGEEMYTQPLDILFALDKAASSPPEGLEGMIDAEHAGAIGYSFDGYNTLAMSGARIDPQYYRSLCSNAETAAENPLSSFSCKPARNWDSFAARVGAPITDSADGLWQPLSDPRIQAVMPLACEGWWVFGEKGLAAADRPALFIVATDDELYAENLKIFEHLGAPEKSLISFVGLTHMMIYDPQQVARMAHFAAAFFGYHLQGQAELAQYFSQEFVDQHADLAWGAYQPAGAQQK